MQVGDLVRYKYRKQDIGIIIETGQYWNPDQGVDVRAPKHKVMWLRTPHLTDWMQPTGLEVISATS